MPSKVSAEGLAEIAGHEGVVTSPYRDSVGVLTVYIGHTAAAGDPDPASLPMGKPQPVAKALDVFEQDIARTEARVRKAFTRPLTQAAFDAAASFDLNTGAIDCATWVKLYNAGDMTGARKAFMNWRKPSEIVPRRRKERDLFFEGKYANGGFAMVYLADDDGRVQWSSGRRVKVADILNVGGDDATAQEPVVLDPAPRLPADTLPPPVLDSRSPVAQGIAVAAMAVLAGVAAGWDHLTTWIGAMLQ